MLLSQEARTALYQLSNDVACDMWVGGDDAECVAESVMGVMFSHDKKVAEELSALCKEHGYDKVLKEASKHVGTL
jgi:hypothetical protein